MGDTCSHISNLRTAILLGLEDDEVKSTKNTQTFQETLRMSQVSDREESFNSPHIHEKDKFINNFVNEELESRPTVVFNDGTEYTGQWKVNIRQGYGVEKDPVSKTVYEGNWYQNKQHGMGKRTFEDGDYYEGDFKQGFACGYGVYHSFASNHRYEGYWENDIPHGHGVEKKANG